MTRRRCMFAALIPFCRLFLERPLLIDGMRQSGDGHKSGHADKEHKADDAGQPPGGIKLRNDKRAESGADLCAGRPKSARPSKALSLAIGRKA